MHLKATEPYNEEAVATSDEEIYRQHEGDKRPNRLYDKDGNRKPLDLCDTSHGDLREEWMGTYKREGGEVIEDNGRICPTCEPVAPCMVEQEEEKIVEELQTWKITINGLENQHLSDARDYVSDHFSLKMYFKYEIVVEITVKNMQGKWVFHSGKIKDVKARIEPDIDEDYTIVLRTEFENKQDILNLNNQDIVAVMKQSPDTLHEGEFDDNIKNYIKQGDAQYIKLMWSHIIPTAVMISKVKPPHNKKYEEEVYDEIHNRVQVEVIDLTGQSQNNYSSDNFFTRMDHHLPLTDGHVEFDIRNEDMPKGVHWLKYEYDIKKIK